MNEKVCMIILHLFFFFKINLKSNYRGEMVAKNYIQLVLIRNKTAFNFQRPVVVVEKGIHIIKCNVQIYLEDTTKIKESTEQ